ncbi:MAG: type IV pilus modification PilV family protein [Planctomycetota bacterium]|jgi:prepilin-type N-terminal cleavage/methylation domain-containing protein
MKCSSEKNLFFTSPSYRGFTLVEVMGALVILAIVSSSVVVVINRCMASAADMELRIQAFELARQNMEKLLTSDSAKEMVEYGTSYKYPEIQWQNVVETFYEPATAKMWLRAVCSAEYYDTEGELQTVELTHWLSGLTEKQVSQLLEQRQRLKERLAESGELFATIEEAAEYARVDVETIEQWVEDGMFITDDGQYPRVYLDPYFEYDGYPPPEALEEADLDYADQTGRPVMSPQDPFRTSSPDQSGQPSPSTPDSPQQRAAPPISFDRWVEVGLPPEMYYTFFPNARPE